MVQRTLAVSPAVAAGPQPRGTEDADEENNAYTSSVIFTEVGGSRASNHAVSYVEEDADGTAVAEPLMERQTSRACRSAFTAKRLELSRQATSIINHGVVP